MKIGEVRVAFQKCNLQRWDLMRTLQGSTDPTNPTDSDIATEYFGISADPDAAVDEKRLILETNPTVAGQQEVWGETGNAGWLNTVSNVKTFLHKIGLEYNELLVLLDLKFINPAGDITVHHLDASCDTDQKAIQGLDEQKLDRIHRFLRLWRKLNGWKMWELDLVIGHAEYPALGNGDLNEAFLIQLFYFDQLKKRLDKQATVEQVCALFGDLNTQTHFTRLHKKREDGLYKSLFLNRKLIQPLDPALQIDPSTGNLPLGETITAHHSVVLAALGISESELVLLKGLTKASDGMPYITDELTLSNLSFLWRHAWLSKLLQFKAEEWMIVLKIFQQDIPHFANPQAAWEFVETIDHLKATDFKPDELNWLLTADRSAKAAVKEADAARFLTALRKDLQQIQTEHDPSLSKTMIESTIIQQSSTQLGLTEDLTRYLLTNYELPIPPFPPKTKLLPYLIDDLSAKSGEVNYASFKLTFDSWFWASRVADILKKWKITFVELKRIIAFTAEAQLLDFSILPLDDTKDIPSIEGFLRTSRLLRLRDRLPETKITFLEVLEKLNENTPPTIADLADSNFPVEVQRVNDTWLEEDVKALIASLNIASPSDYLMVETWERLRRAFYFLDNLNTGADTAQTFAATAMTDVHAKTIKDLLRSKFGTETWLTWSTEVQDVLRKRKRDALAAYLLTRPKPDDAPSGKWENTNDLYAYYLLDVEMSSCQLTSRLVQSSGSVQLFVQRCFMCLEPDVVVKAAGDDGDSGWHWWQWMRKYRVWEANRKVFFWPENWIEPELKKDRSPFFKDLENELLQNEINQHNVEKAFTNYLEKLDGVAQLEIAGFYQEDDGDNTIIHVFGRTTGAEPHLYYYRRYDYRQWTPWEKVELDIQGDYLIPAVVWKVLP